MKQVKIAYEKCKERMPHRPPDEIDFGLGWRAALKLMLERLDDDGPNIPARTLIERELE